MADQHSAAEVNPYYEDDAVKLYHGDSREALEQMPEKSVACVITDPPYSENTHSMAKTNRSLRGKDVKVMDFGHVTLDDLDTAFVHMGRISRSWVISNLDYKHAFHFDWQPPEGLRMLRIGVWVKPNPMPQISGDRPGQGWEAIAFMHRDDVRPAWNGGGRSGVWTHPVQQNSGHPTTKPLSMVRDWVRLFTKPGDTILDPYAGSGTTLRAAADEGRKAIGYEIDERYCEITAKRLGQQAFDFDGWTA